MPDPIMIRCSNCGALNRVLLQKVQQGLEAVCGRCKSPLPVAQPMGVTDATFSTEVEHFPLPVLVDLWAEWCGPCRMIAPVIEQLASEMAGRIRVAKLNVDENPVTAQRFGVQSIPTMLVLKDGCEVDRIVGAYPKTGIVRRIERVIASSGASEPRVPT
jgi:thioredoxin 2